MSTEIEQEALAYNVERLRKLQENGDWDDFPTMVTRAIAYLESGRLTARGQAIEMIAKRMAWQGVKEAVPQEQIDEDCDEEIWWERAYRPETRNTYRQRAEELFKMLGSTFTIGEL